MEGLLSRIFFSKSSRKDKVISTIENLSQGKVNKEYLITDIKSNDEEMEKFLFSLGCYKDEVVTLVSILGDTYVIKIKDGRYSIDKELALSIKIKNI
ncbi:FeoA family protein [Clostridium sp.]|uniref:FeoA family protein n=1 Tax=Clostridium sp. TaxID=1506 RepID=UPI003F37980A